MESSLYVDVVSKKVELDAIYHILRAALWLDKYFQPGNGVSRNTDLKNCLLLHLFIWYFLYNFTIVT